MKRLLKAAASAVVTTATPSSVSGTRDGAADGLTSHGWVIIDGCYYDPEAQFAGWYRGVYGSGSYDINHQIKSIVRFAS